jgi:hypothetical protein
MTGSNIWDQVLARIETKVNRHSFYTWFKPTSFVSDRDGSILVRVPNALFRDWLTKHYAAVIDEALAEVQRPGAPVSFVTEDVPAPLPEPAPQPEPDADEPRKPISGILSPRYSFDTFIVGSSNQFAHAACRAVAEAPSRSYNPLFIYGGVGLGKTHLMHAIGHYVATHLTNLKLTYISSERFMNEMINAVRYDRISTSASAIAASTSCSSTTCSSSREGRHADRVLPHVQRALRLAEADRHQLRLSAARDSAAGGTAAIALRMGADRRHPAARPRDEDRDPEAQGGDRRAFRFPTTWRSTSPARSSRTSASSRDRSSG